MYVHTLYLLQIFTYFPYIFYTICNKTQVELMLEYKERIKNQVIEWFDNIKKQPLEINKASDGRLVTPNPQVFNPCLLYGFYCNCYYI